MNSKRVQQKKIEETIRRNSTPSRRRREPCAVCHRFENITDAHHILDVAMIAKAALTGRIVQEAPVIWLCPNCHAWAHRLNVNDPDLIEFYPLAAVYRLGALVALKRVWLEQVYARHETNASYSHRIFLLRDLPLPQEEYFDAAEFWDAISFEPIGFAIEYALSQDSSS